MPRGERRPVLEGINSVRLSPAGLALGRRVPGTQINDPDEGRPVAESGTAESEVVSDDHALLTGGALQDLGIGATNQLLIPRRPHVTPAVAQSCDNLRPDVLVCQERKVERSHAVMLNSQRCSPFSASAA